MIPAAAAAAACFAAFEASVCMVSPLALQRAGATSKEDLGIFSLLSFSYSTSSSSSSSFCSCSFCLLILFARFVGKIRFARSIEVEVWAWENIVVRVIVKSCDHSSVTVTVPPCHRAFVMNVCASRYGAWRARRG